jgi:hypothetical protein
MTLDVGRAKSRFSAEGSGVVDRLKVVLVFCKLFFAIAFIIIKLYLSKIVSLFITRNVKKLKKY